MNVAFESLAPVLIATSLVDILRSVLELPAEILRGYSSLLRWAADAVQSLFERYGYWVVFLGTFCENTLFVGLIVPGALVVILAGLAAENGTISPGPALALGALGTMCGDTVSYFLGRFGWSRLNENGTIRAYTEQVREPILRKGVLFVLVYHFAGYTRLVGPAAAGLLKMPFGRWAAADYTGATIWVAAYMALGYGLGALGFDLDDTDGWFRAFEWILLVLVMFWGFMLIRSAQTAFLAATEAGSKDAKDREAVGSPTD